MIQPQEIAKINPKYLRRRIMWKAVNRQRASFVQRIVNLWKRKIRAYIDGELLAINDAMRITYVEVGGKFGRSQKKRLLKRKAFGDISDDIDQKLADYTQLRLGSVINSIQRNVTRKSREILMTEDLTIAEQAAFIDEFITRRANVIAQHEIVSSSIIGADIGAEEAGIELGKPIFKTWIATIDGRVRDGHEAADGQTVDKNARFIVMGEALLRPRDPAGSAGNTINCRCALDYQIIEV